MPFFLSYAQSPRRVDKLRRSDIRYPNDADERWFRHDAIEIRAKWNCSAWHPVRRGWPGRSTSFHQCLRSHCHDVRIRSKAGHQGILRMRLCYVGCPWKDTMTIFIIRRHDALPSPITRWLLPPTLMIVILSCYISCFLCITVVSLIFHEYICSSSHSIHPVFRNISPPRRM